MAGFQSRWWGSKAGMAAFAAAAGTMPLSAQDAPVNCSQLSGAEEVDCLRRALQQTREALARAEQALGSAETSRAEQAETVEPELGAEQAARRTGTRPSASEDFRVLAAIVSSERVHPNQLQVHLENGQTWRQIHGDTQIVELPRGKAASAEIWRSGFGGYRMRVPQVQRVLKVERIR